MKKTFQEENNEILMNTIQKGFIEYLQNPTGRRYTRESMGIELYISPECNQKCSYCYLCNHGDEIYPKEIRNRTNIMKNFKIFLDYCVENKLKPQHFDLFSGEIWEGQFGVDILTTLAEVLEKQKDFMPDHIMIPSNCSFIMQEKSLERIEAILERINNNPDIPTRICFSCSNDGYWIDNETRPLNNPKKYEIEKGNKVYYDKLFAFCKKWGFGFHPMVSAHGIEAWEKNFEWWFTELRAHEFEPLSGIMLLETRNDNWTDDKIESYLKYLNFSVNYIIEKEMPHYEGDPLENYYKYINGTLKRSFNKYNSLRPTRHAMWPACSIARTLTIRLGDLAIVPCHRTSYEQFLIGKFKVDENDKIVGVEAKNLQMMNQIWLNNMMGNAKCGDCPYADLCSRGCYGAQYESTKELLFPCETVCNLYKAQLIFLYHKYTKLGFIKENEHRPLFNELIKLINQVKGTKEYEKWSKKVLEII